MHTSATYYLDHINPPQFVSKCSRFRSKFEPCLDGKVLEMAMGQWQENVVLIRDVRFVVILEVFKWLLIEYGIWR